MRARRVLFLLADRCPDSCAGSWEDPVLDAFRALVLAVDGRVLRACAVVWWDTKASVPRVDVYADESCLNEVVDVEDAEKISVAWDIDEDEAVRMLLGS